jgi:predicted component of type VI protein secretion system
LIAKFSKPEFRFEVIEVNLDNLDATQRAEMLNLELGDFVQVKFTPSDIPPAIERYGEVISTKSKFTPTSEIMQIGLQSVQGALVVLDTEAFGRLDSESVLGF